MNRAGIPLARLKAPEVTAVTAVTALVVWLGLEVSLMAALSNPAATVAFGLLLGAVVAITLRQSAGRGLATAATATIVFGMVHLSLLATRGQALQAASWTPMAVAGLLFATAVAVGELVAVNLARAQALLPDAAPPPARPDGSAPPGREEGLRRLEKLMSSPVHRRRLCLALLELTAGDTVETLVEGLAERLPAGLAIAYADSQLLLALPGTGLSGARVLVAELQSSSGLIASILPVEEADVAGGLLQELMAGLEVCRATGLQLADPLLLAAPVPQAAPGAMAVGM